MKKSINIHPNSNSGEAAKATVVAEDRTMKLEIELNGYGNHKTKSEIYFDNSLQMIQLGEALVEGGKMMAAHFQANP